MEKLKFKALKGLFGMFVFFGILKKCNYLFMPEQDFLFNIVILLQSWRNKPTYFAFSPVITDTLTHHRHETLSENVRLVMVYVEVLSLVCTVFII